MARVISPVGAALANAFLLQFEKNWVQNCPSDLKPHYNCRCVDDIFVLFSSSKPLEPFRNFLNCQHC